MEAPSSPSRVTGFSLQSNMSKLGAGDGWSRSENRRDDLHAPSDLTSESPIAGVTLGATEGKTLKSSIRKTIPGPGPGGVPCSGENLPRCQVKTLLQRVEEEPELQLPKVENQHLEGKPGVMALDGLDVDTVKETEDLVTRAITFDSPKKTQAATSAVSIPSSCASTYQEKATDMENDHSGRSVHADVSLLRPQKSGEEDDAEEGELEEEEGEIDDSLCEELCTGLSKVSVGESGGLPAFEGIHTRFIYNSDDEIGEEEVVVVKRSSSPNVLHLKGLPTPMGKHMRFPEEEDMVTEVS